MTGAEYEATARLLRKLYNSAAVLGVVHKQWIGSLRRNICRSYRRTYEFSLSRSFELPSNEQVRTKTLCHLYLTKTDERMQRMQVTSVQSWEQTSLAGHEIAAKFMEAAEQFEASRTTAVLWEAVASARRDCRF